METVSFTRMSEGTVEDYALLDKLEHEFTAKLPDRIMAALAGLEHTLSGYKVSRLGHSLQSATRAHQDNQPVEYIVAALVHDIGDDLAPYSHSELAASVLRPFVDDRLHWIVKHHGVFQLYYYGEQMGMDRNVRDRFKNHPWFDDAVEFCEKYDENCFDPDFENLPLAFFEPMVREVFSREPSFGELAV